MSVYYSGFSASVESFVNSRKISGAWNETVFGMNIRLFDRYCAEHYPGEALRQEMVDIWCARRKTENVNSCYTRTLVIHLFIGYLRKRGQTDVLAPPALKQNKERRIPHAFSHEELERFFRECDRIIPCRGRLSHASELRKITCPVFFRLLYSSGIRTTEARFLTRSGVDFAQGILDIQKSKGYDQHYVALHPSMTELLERYDRAADRLSPGRTYFFESPGGHPYSRTWVSYNFSLLWEKANGKKGGTVAYDLRHNYATANINGWKDDVFEFNDRLNYLARSMGHRCMESTLYYYSVVPGLAGIIQEKTEENFNSIVPEVAYEEE